MIDLCVQGFLQDSMDMLDYVMTRNNVMPRMNARVLGTSQKYVDLSQRACTLSLADCNSSETSSCN